MAVSYFAEDVKMPAIKKRETTDWIRRVASGYGKKCGDIAYIFCSDEKILEVNKAYLQFDYTEGDKISGDIFISVDTVRSNAEQFGTDYDEELHRIIIHGVLHLCGINDKGPGEREMMTRHENEALKLR